MSERLRIGYLPLLDAALLLVADRKRFAADRGLELELIRETSWASIRDKLAVGYFDAAHMLAPAAIACSLGIGQVRAPLFAPVSLGLNGNAITVSRSLYGELLAHSDGDIADPAVSACALGEIVAGRRHRQEPGLVFAHVFPFSSHHYQLRTWLKAGGVDPDQDVSLVVLPPPFMVRGLEKGQVDGFCVGAPWNSIAVDDEAGVILHAGRDIVQNCPEKVLAMHKEWAISNTVACAGLTSAIQDAAAWCVAPRNRQELGEILYEQVASATNARVIDNILAGELIFSRDRRRRVDDYLDLSRPATHAYREQALWIYGQMVSAGQAFWSEAQADEASAVYPDDPESLPVALAPRAFNEVESTSLSPR